MTADLEQGSPDTSVVNEGRPAGTAVAGSELRDLFRRFLSLEGEVKLVNEHKAEIFAEAKKLGFDSKALRAAFRHRVREIEKPENATHDALTDSYLAILRGAEGNGPAFSSSRGSASLGPAEAKPDTSARPRAH